MQSDVLIIGAGVFGVSLAYHLQKYNLKVVVLERENVAASHASGKNAGMFLQINRHPKLSEWAKRSRESWPEEIKRKIFKETGSYLVNREAPEHEKDLFQKVEVNGLPAVYTETDGLLDSGGYISELLRLTDKEKVKFVFKETVCKLEKESSCWKIEAASGKHYRATWLVNAAGAWINSFLDGNTSNLSVKAEAFARHLFIMQGFSENYMPAKDCGFYWEEREAWYVRLWDKTSRLVSICDKAPANPDTFIPSENILTELAAKLLKVLPEVASELSVAHSWYCFRTYAEDKLPIYGEDPRAAKLFWLAAFGGYGMSTSFAACADAARYIAGEKVEMPKEFLPRR